MLMGIRREWGERRAIWRCFFWDGRSLEFVTGQPALDSESVHHYPLVRRGLHAVAYQISGQ